MSDPSVHRPKRRYLGIAQRLLQEIQLGQIEEGVRLPADRDLAARFGVSRGTVREAIFALELIGVLEVRHGDGTYVAPYQPGGRSLDSLMRLEARPQDIIDTRLVLEPPLCALLTTNLDNLDIDAIERDLDYAESIIGQRDRIPQFTDLALKFHYDLATGCSNAIIRKVTAELLQIDEQPLWLLINQLVLQEQPARQNLIDEHREILRAVKGSSESEASESMRQHLESNKSQIFITS